MSNMGQGGRLDPPATSAFRDLARLPPYLRLSSPMWVAWFRLGVAPICAFVVLRGVAPADGATKTVTVQVFVDEEEPRQERIWQRELAERVDQASRILSRYSQVRFSVSKFGKWRSNNAITDFALSLKEFEDGVKPQADIAIGFSSQYQLQLGRSHLGGTRGPLRSHIFIREGAPKILETERLEVLVHELGHYLGAAHSKKLDSVMRPVLGDALSRRRSFQIRLDTQNSRIVRLVSTEAANRRVRSMHQLSVQTKLQLRNEYLKLAAELPEDPVAKRYALLMDQSIRRDLRRAKRLPSRIGPTTTNPVPGQSSRPNVSKLPR